MSILLPVGKVSKLFGLDGGVLVNLYDTFPGNMDNGEPLFVKMDGLAVPLFTEHFERRGRSGALVRFADIDTPGRAGELLGHEIYVSQGEKSDGLWLGRGGGIEVADGHEEKFDPEEVFFDDLVGYMAVVSGPDGKAHKGRVTAFIDSEFNPLLQLEIEGKEAFIPAADEFIGEIDTIRQEISFVIPDGLLDLYL